MKARVAGRDINLYGHDDASVIDVSELDGMLTAVFRSFVARHRLVAVWGGEKYIPRWKNDRDEPFYRSLL